jgi:hypothetical protein
MIKESTSTDSATIRRFVMTTIPFALVTSVFGEILVWLVVSEIGSIYIPVGCCEGWEGLGYLMLYAYIHMFRLVLVPIVSGILAYLVHWGFHKRQGGALFVRVGLSIGVIVLGTLLLSFSFPFVILLLGMLLPI